MDFLNTSFSLIPSESIRQEFTNKVTRLLPAGSKILIVGGGSGWLGEELARTSQFLIELIDPSAHVTDRLQEKYHQQGLSINIKNEDIFIPTRVEYDLVFNFGSLTLLPAEERLVFVKQLAARSRKYLYLLTVNPHCYWYEVWKSQQSAGAILEYPQFQQQPDFKKLFQQADCHFIREEYLGGSEIDFLMKSLDGMTDIFHASLQTVHQSPNFNSELYHLIVAGLGEVSEASIQHRIQETPEQPALLHLMTVWSAEKEQSQKLIRLLEEKLTNQVNELQEKETKIYNLQKTLTTLQTELEKLQGIAKDADQKIKSLNSMLWSLGEDSRRLRLWDTSKPWKLIKAYWRIRSRLPFAKPIEIPFLGSHMVLKTESDLLRYQREVARMVNTHSNKGEVIIFSPSIEWNIHLFQRPQQLALALARLGNLVFYPDPPVDKKRTLEIKEYIPNLFLLNMDLEVLSKIRSPLVFTLCYNSFYLRYFQKPHIIYEYIDELSIFPGGLEANLAPHIEMLKKADVVLATAQRLHEQIKPIRPDALLSPNAVDYDHFASARDADTPPPEDIADIVNQGKPIIGYYGALAEWFDYPLVQEMAIRQPDWNFLLIGPAYDSSLEKSNILSQPNIYWLGIKDYQDLPNYLHFFDVAFIPFVLNDLTHSTSPLKLFEFMAGGKPVVISPMNESMRTEGVLVADGVDEFIGQILNAIQLSSDRDYLSKIDSVARENTWENRARQIMEKFKQKSSGHF